jgi:predicted RNA-binding protein YlxR (DUF448 family)
MCLGCRERLCRDELIRLQLTAEGIVIVEHKDQIKDGRSAYLCPKVQCLDKALRHAELVFKRSKYDRISVRLDQRQAERVRYAFSFAARRLRSALGVGPN